jgi:hypothetical protein
MALSRFASRLLAPMTLSRLSMIGSKSGPVRSFFHHHRRNLPETYFASASNIFKSWEKEFERMQEQFNNYFRDLKNNRPITNYSPGGNGKFYFHRNRLIDYFI